MYCVRRRSEKPDLDTLWFPEEAITESKLQHMIDAATHYLIELNPIPDWRLDVISIELYQGKRTQPVIH